MIGRRELFVASGAAAAFALHSKALACSPLNPASQDFVRSFFATIARRRYQQANALLTPNARLTIVSFDDAKQFVGADIVRRLSNLLFSDGYRLIGDTPQRTFGGYWEEQGGWFRSDMIKAGRLNVETDQCGSGSLRGISVAEPVLNVSVTHDGSRIKQVLVQSSYVLSYAGPPLPEDS